MMPVRQRFEFPVPNRSPVFIYGDDAGVNRFGFVGVTFVKVRA
jgi:hypothetical protein